MRIREWNLNLSGSMRVCEMILLARLDELFKKENIPFGDARYVRTMCIFACEDIGIMVGCAKILGQA